MAAMLGDQDMDVVGHDTPGMEIVALAVEEAERILNEMRNARIAQPAGRVTLVQDRLCLFSPSKIVLV